MNAVILTEAVFVILLSVICFQYVINLRKRETSEKLTANTESTKVRTIQLRKLNSDEKEELISANIHDLLILGRNIHITHIAFPNDPTISAQHCRFILKDEKLYLEDLDSKNGTYLNGIKITDRKPVTSGDRLQLGMILLQILWK